MYLVHTDNNIRVGYKLYSTIRFSICTRLSQNFTNDTNTACRHFHNNIGQTNKIIKMDD